MQLKKWLFFAMSLHGAPFGRKMPASAGKNSPAGIRETVYMGLRYMSAGTKNLDKQ